MDCNKLKVYNGSETFICKKGLISFHLLTNDQNHYFINGFIPRGYKRIDYRLAIYKKDFIDKEKEIKDFIGQINIFCHLIDEKIRNSIEKNFSVFHDIKTTTITITRCAENLINKLPGDSFEKKMQLDIDLLDLYDSISLLSDQLAMIDILVNTSKIKYAKKRPINVFQLFERISKLLRRNASLRDVKIQWHDNGKIDDCLLYPSFSFLPLVLIDNAIKYSFNSKVIDIGIFNNLENIRIYVSSFGELVPEKDREIIFEKFKRGGNASDKKGIGMGLWIAKQICFAHDGDIRYETSGTGNVGENRFVAEFPKIRH